VIAQSKKLIAKAQEIMGTTDWDPGAEQRHRLPEMTLASNHLNSASCWPRSSWAQFPLSLRWMWPSDGGQLYPMPSGPPTLCPFYALI